MNDAPNNQQPADKTEGKADQDIAPIIGPPPATIPQPPPAPPKDQASTKKRRWTKDPAMFWVTLAGVIAVIAYTSVAAWQAYLMQGQLGEIKQQSAAIERQSFAGRAYLFPRYVFNPQSYSPQDTSFAEAIKEGITEIADAKWLRTSITYCVDNAGQTPGIITDIESHLFLPKGPGEFFPGNADMDSAVMIDRRETFSTPTFTPDNSFFDKVHGMNDRINVPASTKYCQFKTSFVYRGRPMGFPSIHGARLYIFITYQDVFGIVDRHTWYEAGLYGASSMNGNPKYNHWD